MKRSNLAVEPDYEDVLTPRDRLLAQLQADVKKLVSKAMQDRNEPRLSDWLFVVGELCRPEHRRDPAKAAEQLERVIEANASNEFYSRHLGPYVGLLRKYDHQRRRYVGSVMDIIENEEAKRAEGDGRGLGSEPSAPALSQPTGTTSRPTAGV